MKSDTTRFKEPSMQTIKQTAHELIDHLPDQATWDDVMYSLYVRQKIEEGLKDVEAGRVVTHEEAKRRLLDKQP
jgi:predicted transcriptional regulator